MTFPGYGAGPGGFPGMQQDPLYGYFSAVAGQDGQISADELQRCLTQSGISGSYQPFSLETCRLMINMLDRDMSCTMGFNEFKDLWQALNGWRATFGSFDRDQSGTIEGQELQQAIKSMGYGLSPQAMNCIMKRYSLNGRIPFDEFVSCAVRLRALTDQFRRRDTTQTGNASFQYDDFIQVTMSI
ncbi:sorcin isoform X2 [Neolamprologus brichardi]|uniref:sorcin isoform X1 n=1 Tax=Neolamprologus brichardi TaxID=32507 RepID=UPI0003EC4C06|nr:sorcin isoform X1 [Neolamprologus brichardi]XP_006791826.1 sorcin isoform X2 [Neolamprologus brichardi]